MANMNLVTGYAGQAHISAADVGSFNAALVGSGQYVLQKGNMLSASAVTNNTIRVLDGDILMQGRHGRIEPNTSVDLAIENGASGYYRNDLIVARYTKDVSTGVEAMNLVVIKGTASTGLAADPEYTSGDIVGSGTALNDMPLYRVRIDGLNIQTLETMFAVLGNIGEHVASKNNPHGVTAAQVGAKASGAVEPITQGGTGATTAEQARKNLGITPAVIGASAVGHNHALDSLNGTLPVTMGGTGGTTAEEARTNLGASASGHTHTLDSLNNVHICDSTPTSLTEGHWYLIKDA